MAEPKVVAHLLALDEHTFARVVDQDRKRHGGPVSGSTAEALRHDDVLDRWIAAIDRMRAGTEQSIAQAADPTARVRAVRALEGWHERRREAKALIANRNRRITAEREASAQREREERHRLHRESRPERVYARALRMLRDAHPDEFEGLLVDAEAIEAAEMCVRGVGRD